MFYKLAILNITPDSFSDGSEEILRVENSINKAKLLIDKGANIIDLGAESTRPGAEPVKEDEEFARLEFFLKNYNYDSALSLDSRNPVVVEKALKLNNKIKYINDVTGLHNEALLNVLEKAVKGDGFDFKFIAMHSKGGVPPQFSTAQTPDNYYEDAGGMLEHFKRFFEKTIKSMEHKGLKTENLILDPGLGFGKSLRHSLEIPALIPELKSCFGRPVLIGASRKGFLRLWKNKENPSIEELDQWSEEYNQLCLDNGAEYLRVHKI